MAISFADLRRIAALLLAGAAFATPAAPAEEQSISEAEKRLLMTNQMKNVAAPARLRYRYVKSGTLESAREDDALVSVARGADGKGTVTHVDFLTGKDNFKLPDIDNAEGNPLLLFFLERELAEMKRLTGGSANYYRKRIRLALAEEASVKTIEIEHAGRKLNATEIRVSPYLNDPARPRYEKFAGKYYVFTLSDEIPGGIYQLRTTLGQPGDTLLEETVTFTSLAR